MTGIETVLRFLELINHHDADNLSEMMTEDHVFIDSLGQAVRGREEIRKAWRGYYTLCPNYWISHEEIFQHGNLVAVFGAAGGTISEDGKLPAGNKWRTPAAWLAEVNGSLIKEWRVYADNKPVYDIVTKSKTSAGT